MSISLFPTPSRLRSQLKDKSIACTPKERATIDVTRGIENNSAAGYVSVDARLKGMQDGLSPSATGFGMELKNPAIAVVAAGAGGAIKITSGVGHESIGRPSAISSSGKTVEHILGLSLRIRCQENGDRK